MPPAPETREQWFARRSPQVQAADNLHVPRIEGGDHLRRFPVDLGLPFQVLREAASAGERQSLLRLRLVPVARSQQSSLPSSLEFCRDLDFGHVVFSRITNVWTG